MNQPHLDDDEIEAQLYQEEETKVGTGMTRSDQLTKLFGPTQSQIKKKNNPIIKKNEWIEKKKKQEHREKMIKGTIGNAVFDFLGDFSSSDYEEFSAKEIERRNAKRQQAIKTAKLAAQKPTKG